MVLYIQASASIRIEEFAKIKNQCNISYISTSAVQNANITHLGTTLALITSEENSYVTASKNRIE